MKTNSSRWVHEKWSRGFGWQTGYGVFSVSESNIAAVTKYIAEQKAHHQKHSFQEEFVAFLKKNNVTYDERYSGTYGISFFRPSGLAESLCPPMTHGLAPWAAFCAAPRLTKCDRPAVIVAPCSHTEPSTLTRSSFRDERIPF